MKNKKLLVLLMVLAVLIGSGFTFGNSVVNTSDMQVVSTIGNAMVDMDNGSDVVKVMGNIYIPADRVVSGDVVAIMGNIKLDGRVNGDVVAVMGNVEINNEVSGDVVSVMGNVTKGPNGKIGGEKVEVNGSNLNMIPSNISNTNFNIGWNGFHFNWGLKFFNLVLLSALGSLVLALMPEKTKAMAWALGEEPFKKFLIGFLALIVTPFVVLISAVSIIGLPLVPFIILAFIAIKFIGYVAIVLYIGSRIRQTASLNLNIFLELFIGILILWLVKLVPIVGLISSLIVTMFALGVIIDTKFGTHNPWFKRKAYQQLPLHHTAKSDETEVNEPKQE